MEDYFDFNNEEHMKIASKKILKKMQKEGKTLAQALDMSENLLEEIYQLGYTYYNQGKYKEAVSLFYLLVGTSPSSFKYVFALAATFHQMEDFQDASIGFALAFRLDRTNPLPVYYAADCLLKQNATQEAKELFELTVELCGTKEEYSILKERALLIKNTLIN